MTGSPQGSPRVVSSELWAHMLARSSRGATAALGRVLSRGAVAGGRPSRVGSAGYGGAREWNIFWGARSLRSSAVSLMPVKRPGGQDPKNKRALKKERRVDTRIHMNPPDETDLDEVKRDDEIVKKMKKAESRDPFDGKMSMIVGDTYVPPPRRPEKKNLSSKAELLSQGYSPEDVEKIHEAGHDRKSQSLPSLTLSPREPRTPLRQACCLVLFACLLAPPSTWTRVCFWQRLSTS